MGIFDKGHPSSDVAKETSVISERAIIKGDFTLESNLHVDGEIEGTIQSSNTVSIGKSGVIRGEIFAQKVLVSGVVRGKINADEIEIVTGGRVIGEIFVDNLIIQNMGVFSGICHQKSGSDEELIEFENEKRLELKKES